MVFICTHRNAPVAFVESRVLASCGAGKDGNTSEDEGHCSYGAGEEDADEDVWTFLTVDIDKGSNNTTHSIGDHGTPSPGQYAAPVVNWSHVAREARDVLVANRKKRAKQAICTGSCSGHKGSEATCHCHSGHDPRDESQRNPQERERITAERTIRYMLMYFGNAEEAVAAGFSAAVELGCSGRKHCWELARQICNDVVAEPYWYEPDALPNWYVGVGVYRCPGVDVQVRMCRCKRVGVYAGIGVGRGGGYSTLHCWHKYYTGAILHCVECFIEHCTY